MVADDLNNRCGSKPTEKEEETEAGWLYRSLAPYPLTTPAFVRGLIQKWKKMAIFLRIYHCQGCGKYLFLQRNGMEGSFNKFLKPTFASVSSITSDFNV
jgi:hypothetical protein